MPSGYTKKRLIGIVRNDNSLNFMTFRQSGFYREKSYFWDARLTSTLSVLSGGSATSWTDVLIEPLAPGRAKEVFLYALMYHNSSNQTLFVRPEGMTNAGDGLVYIMGIDQSVNFTFPCRDTKYIQYITAGSAPRNAYISVVGFRMEV